MKYVVWVITVVLLMPWMAMAQDDSYSPPPATPEWATLTDDDQCTPAPGSPMDLVNADRMSRGVVDILYIMFAQTQLGMFTIGMIIHDPTDKDKTTENIYVYKSMDFCEQFKNNLNQLTISRVN